MMRYQRFIVDHNFKDVKNCFLMPTENKEVENRGEASMEMLSGLGLQSIKVRFVPATIVYEYYLSGRKLDIRILGL